MSTRTFKQYLSDITRKPLILFPLVALAHILWLLWIVWGNRHVPIYDIEWLQAAWMLGYTIFWIGACDYRKWGALGYIVLTLLNMILFVAVKNINLRELYMSPIFLLDDLFSFFLLFFFKRFD
jgi:hypothetical protein